MKFVGTFAISFPKGKQGNYIIDIGTKWYGGYFYFFTTYANLDGWEPATAGDLGPFDQLLDVVTNPFDERPGLEPYAQPAPAGFGAGYQTFCGT